MKTSEMKQPGPCPKPHRHRITRALLASAILIGTAGVSTNTAAAAGATSPDPQWVVVYTDPTTGATIRVATGNSTPGNGVSVTKDDDYSVKLMTKVLSYMDQDTGQVVGSTLFTDYEGEPIDYSGAKAPAGYQFVPDDRSLVDPIMRDIGIDSRIYVKKIQAPAATDPTPPANPAQPEPTGQPQQPTPPANPPAATPQRSTTPTKPAQPAARPTARPARPATAGTVARPIRTVRLAPSTGAPAAISQPLATPTSGVQRSAAETIDLAAPEIIPSGTIFPQTGDTHNELFVILGIALAGLVSALGLTRILRNR